MTAKSSIAENETRILSHLTGGDANHPGRNHVTAALDSFKHQGPNGLHLCLVSDVMSPSSGSIIKHMPSQLKPPFPQNQEDPYRGRYSLTTAKSIMRQILLGLDFLHTHGVAHGDLQPGNILFSVKSLSGYTEKNLVQPTMYAGFLDACCNDKEEVIFGHLDLGPGKGCYTGRFKDEIQRDSAPRYLVKRAPLHEHVDLDPLSVRISDFGASFFISSPPSTPVTPLVLRSPELILGEPINEKQDIWSFGCLLFEYLTATNLFFVLPPLWGPDERVEVQRASGTVIVIQDGSPRYAEQRDDGLVSSGDAEATEEAKDSMDIDDETNDSHILQIAQRLGPLPSSFMSRWPRAATYFSENGDVVKNFVGELEPGEDEGEIPSLTCIEGFFDEHKGAEISDEDSSAAKSLLQLILQVDAAKRPSAAEILAHPWFAEDNA